MNKCLKMLITIDATDSILKNIQKVAQKYELEGIAQSVDQDTLKIIICGHKDKVDEFVDNLHKNINKLSKANIELEPFIKDKDYRGVFRVID